MRHGYYSDKYFQRTKGILERDGYHPNVLMQVFCKKEGMLGGIDSAIAVLKACAGRYEDSHGNVVPLEERLEDQEGRWVNKYSELEVKALYDGDNISPKITPGGIKYETVMTIKGDYSLFAHLETVYLGLLARGTKIASNVDKVVKAASDIPVLFFPARFDHPAVQTADGYAARIAGSLGVSTDAQAAWWGGEGIGTVPHGLIAAYGGNTALATLKFAEMVDPSVDVIPLVDYENDSVKTSLDVAKAMDSHGMLDRLWGIRLDTAESMVDVSLHDSLGQYKATGVNIPLVFKVREALDAAGYDSVRVVVSGGFDEGKIASFDISGAPVGAYGIGSSLFKGSYDFTADVVQLENDGVMEHQAKVGRRLIDNPRLEVAV
ncbi:MAG: quinolinate phosphoribosyl transferase [Nanoarchaeota archaeon]|nr:quinolinate phosphoribosyl transferase [Nanoarchaeota archaeon]